MNTEGGEVEIKATGPIEGGYDDSYSMYAWSICGDEGWRDYTKSKYEYWEDDHPPNSLKKSMAGNDWWNFFEVHKTNVSAWHYIQHPEVTKLHLKLTHSTNLVGINRISQFDSACGRSYGGKWLPL